MAHRIKVTGYITVEDDEFDSGPNGPLTEPAFMAMHHQLSGFEDLDFEEVEDNE